MTLILPTLEKGRTKLDAITEELALTCGHLVYYQGGKNIHSSPL